MSGPLPSNPVHRISAGRFAASLPAVHVTAR